MPGVFYGRNLAPQIVAPHVLRSTYLDIVLPIYMGMDSATMRQFHRLAHQLHLLDQLPTRVDAVQTRYSNDAGPHEARQSPPSMRLSP